MVIVALTLGEALFGQMMMHSLVNDHMYMISHPEKTRGGFQKLLEPEGNRRVRMYNLQLAKDCASVKTSLATVHARAQRC
jgi:hypothetical protein